MANNENEMTAEAFRARFPELVNIADRLMDAETSEQRRTLIDEHRQAVRALSPENKRFLDEM
jgi:hypothetical protein